MSTALADPPDHGSGTRLVAKIVILARGTTALCAVIAIGVWIVLAALRLRYPYELEHTESGVLEHVRRLTEGRSIYLAPSVDFAPFPYPPGYATVGAALGSIFGVNFITLRLVSILSTCGILWMIWRIVRRETGSAEAGLIAAGIFAASYRLAGAWFDVAKADALFLFLTLAALDLLAHARTRRVAIAAAALMASAIFAKQTAVFVAFPVGALLLVTRRSVGVAFSASLLALVGSLSLLSDAVTDGWYRFYVWEELVSHETLPLTPWHFLTTDLREYWPIVVLAALVGAAWWATERRESGLFWATASFGLIVGAFAALRHVGGYANVLLPACVALAIFGGLALGQLLRSRRPLIALVALSLCLVQFGQLRYDAAAQVPSAADSAAGDALVAYLASLPGEVLVLTHPTYSVLAGRAPHAQFAGAADIARSGSERARRLLLDDFASAIHTQRFSAMVLDEEPSSVFPPDWKDFYVRSDFPAAPPEGALLGRASGSSRPTQLWLPRGPLPRDRPLP